MISRPLSGAPGLRAFSARTLAAVCALALVPAAAPALAHELRQGRLARARLAAVQGPRSSASAILEACQSAPAQEQRSATFTGEMTAVPGTQRMQMSVQVLEWLQGEDGYHVVDAPGLGVWRSSAPGVQSYRYLRQVSNLAAPAFYRAAIRFRWLGAHGKTIQALELHTRRCEQPASLAGEAPAS